MTSRCLRYAEGILHLITEATEVHKVLALAGASSSTQKPASWDCWPSMRHPHTHHLGKQTSAVLLAQNDPKLRQTPWMSCGGKYAGAAVEALIASKSFSVCQPLHRSRNTSPFEPQQMITTCHSLGTARPGCPLRPTARARALFDPAL